MRTLESGSDSCAMDTERHAGMLKTLRTRKARASLAWAAAADTFLGMARPEWNDLAGHAAHADAFALVVSMERAYNAAARALADAERAIPTWVAL